MKEERRQRIVAVKAVGQYYRATVQISEDPRRAYEAEMLIERLGLDLDCANRALERAHRENAQLRAELAERGR